MSAISQAKLPKILAAAEKRGLRTQYAALCYRVVHERTQVLLITSRDTGRWIIPKGWPKKKLEGAEVAAEEAYEEAGVEGRVSDQIIGIYSYTKQLEKGDGLPCMVSVYPLRVKKLLDDFPERKERRRKWFSLKKAASRVHEPELAEILLHFDPAALRRS